MTAGSGQRPVYASAGWEIDLARRELRSMGTPVPLGGRAFEIIAQLVQADGELVSRDDLTERVWRGVLCRGKRAARPHRRDPQGLRPGSGHAHQHRRPRLSPARQLATSARSMRRRGACQRRCRDAVDPTYSRCDLRADRARSRHRASAGSCCRPTAIVSLVGPGGIGKTALALEVGPARRRRDTTPTGVRSNWRRCSDPRAGAVGGRGRARVKQEGEEVSPEPSRARSAPAVLLVLDNCEHVVDAVARLIETIVSRCPGATVLATSREALRIDGEHVYRVPPLGVPPERQAASESALEHTAVELFIDPRARRWDRISSMTRRISTRSPRSAGGSTASRSRSSSPRRARSCSTRRRSPPCSTTDSSILTNGRRTALPRQQHAARDARLELRPAARRQRRGLLRQLGIFAGDFLLDAAGAVAGDARGR